MWVLILFKFVFLTGSYLLHNAHGSSLVATKSFRPFIFGLHVLFSLVETSNLVAILMLLVEESEGSSLLSLSYSLVHSVRETQLFTHLSQSNLLVVRSRDKIVILSDKVRRDHLSRVYVIPKSRRHHSRLLGLQAKNIRVLIDHTWLSDYAWLLHLHSHYVGVFLNHAWLSYHSWMNSIIWLLLFCHLLLPYLHKLVLFFDLCPNEVNNACDDKTKNNSYHWTRSAAVGAATFAASLTLWGMDWIIVVAICAIVEVVSISIVINLLKFCWVVASAVSIIKWLVVFVKNLVSFPVRKIGVVCRRWVLVTRVFVPSIGGSICFCSCS